MGSKYSINSAGRIVAERDIYSLGGFIPKGRLGGFIADETQLSQEGECWLDSGDISARPDVRIKDNAYIGNFIAGDNPDHTDGVTEFSGNTLIPGRFTIKSFATDTKNNVFVKDSFIGVSMDVLCGPSTTATAFPFEQGGFNRDVPTGTLFTSASMHTSDANICRTTVNLCLGKDTYIYFPTGYNCRVFWGYRNTSGQLAYSGESFVVPRNLIKLEHPTYRLAMVHIAKANGTAMTPTDLLATGAKILGHISDSLLMEIGPESASGQYVMDKSSLLMNTDNFGLATTQLRYLAGSMYDTNVYTKTDRWDYKLYGTFRNVERLEYTKYLGDSHRTAATRDTYISAYDCPLLRVDSITYNDSLAAKGNLTLRRCIVPKASFTHDVVNGNTYEDIDFSYANGFIRTIVSGRNLYSSHREGLYACESNGELSALISYPGNMADTARLLQAEENIPLDGSLLEQGMYQLGPGASYEDRKSDSNIRVRTATPIRTEGLVPPSLPSGYAIKAILYLDDSFIVRNITTDTAVIDTEYPYCVMVFRKDDDSSINVTDFIALNRTIRIIDHTKAPEITGSAYVGAGVTVRGDVKLIGDPYVNRVFDVNMWERGSGATTTGGTWEETKVPEVTGYPRLRTRDVFPVDATVDNNFTCASGYEILIYYFGEDGKCSGYSPWGTSLRVSDPVVAYISIIVRKVGGTEFIDFSDIPLANVKYLRAFKKRRYIVNELDRTSPEDILLDADMWERGYLDRIDGKTYEELKSSSGLFVRMKRPINTGMGAESSFGAGHDRKDVSFDAVTKCISADSTIVDGTPLYGTTVYKVPSAAISVSDVANSRFKVEFVPSPRIIVPYGQSTLFISGPKIRMYDNAVLSRNFRHDADIVLQGDAVMGYDFSSGDCLCSNGHDDAIIKLP